MKRLLYVVVFVLIIVVLIYVGRPTGNVAVVRIQGVLYEADPIVGQLERLRKSDEVKAVVLRVDSPGGGVAASQEIHDAVKGVAEKKTVVASMGSVAASGGYYVALPAKKILANPGTITGSIGVRMEHVNFEDLLRWLRVRPETLKSGKWKDVGSPTRPMTSEERVFLQTLIKKLHQQFKTAVAQGRRLEPEAVEGLSQGQVFTGEEALQNGLVDGMGNLNEAIRMAAELAGIKDEPDVFYPPREYETLRERIFEGAARLGVAFFAGILSPRMYVSF